MSHCKACDKPIYNQQNVEEDLCRECLGEALNYTTEVYEDTELISLDMWDEELLEPLDG